MAPGGMLLARLVALPQESAHSHAKPAPIEARTLVMAALERLHQARPAPSYVVDYRSLLLVVGALKRNEKPSRELVGDTVQKMLAVLADPACVPDWRLERDMDSRSLRIRAVRVRATSLAQIASAAQ